MTAAATEILALLAPDSPDTWPQGILAAADLREQRAKAATPGPYTASRYERTGDRPTGGEIFTPDPERKPVPYTWLFADAEHIAAEANPRHSLDEVSLARTLAKVWDRLPDSVRVAAVQAARSYLGGGAA